jgi:hypothetical protein
MALTKSEKDWLDERFKLLRETMIHHKNGSNTKFNQIIDRQNKQNSGLEKAMIRLNSLELSPLIKLARRYPYTILFFGGFGLLYSFGFISVENIMRIIDLFK